MSKSKRLNKEILSKSIDEVLGIDDTDLVNNVVDVLVSSGISDEYEVIRPRRERQRGMVWNVLNQLSTVSKLARRMTDWLFPVPKTPPSFYAGIW